MNSNIALCSFYHSYYNITNLYRQYNLLFFRNNYKKTTFQIKEKFKQTVKYDLKTTHFKSNLFLYVFIRLIKNFLHIFTSSGSGRNHLLNIHLIANV